MPRPLDGEFPRVCTAITIDKHQFEWVRSNVKNFSAMVRAMLEERMKDEGKGLP